MKKRWRVTTLAIGLAAVPPLAWHFAAPAQQPGPAPKRFSFQIVECFNAKYLGDTPGHVGRGALQGTRPDVALGDPVFHGEARIGEVTGLLWDRSKESLEVEFDPEPFEEDAQGRPIRANRITVGEEVWVPLGGAAVEKPR